MAKRGVQVGIRYVKGLYELELVLAHMTQKPTQRVDEGARACARVEST
jgi:hypothetical protein